MTHGYTDTPHNIAEILPYVITQKNTIVPEILGKQKCFFYDTCSFRRHSNMNSDEAEYFLKYLKLQNGIIVITRCILMELASHSGLLNHEYIEYIKHIKAILNTGTDGNINVLGTLIYDIRNREISMSIDKLTDLIMSPNGIHIIF